MPKKLEYVVAGPRNTNARGAVDAAIKFVSEQLARAQAAENLRDWAALVPREVAAYSDPVHSALAGRDP